MTSQDIISQFLQLLCFLTDFAQILHRDASSYNKQNAKFCWDWLRNDVTMMSSLILRTRFVKSTLQRMCSHGNIKHCILLKLCTEVLIIISKDSSKFCEDWLRNSDTVMSLLSWMGWFRISVDSKCVAMGTLTARFCSNLIQRYNLVFLTKLQIFVKIDWEMASQWLHYCFAGLNLSEVPLQESVSMATAKNLHSNFYLLKNFYIFSGKVIKFGWIIFLPLWVMGKNLKGGANPPGQDRVKTLFWMTYVWSKQSQ